MNGQSVPRVLVTCRRILPGYWLRFGVENLADYNDGELPIPFRRQLVLLGVEGKRRIPDWMLRLANDRVGWDNYPWGSRAYFDGGIGQAERVPRHLNRQNMYEVPSELYRQFEEQKRDLEKQKREIEEIKRNEAEQRETYEKVRKFMEDMNVEVVPHHSRHIQTAAPSSISQSAIPSHPGTYNWQSTIPSYMSNSNLQPPIGRHDDVAGGLFDQNILIQGKREHRPSIYKRSPFMEQPPSTVLPKQRGNKTKKNVKKSNLSPLNLGNALDDENEGGDDVIFLGGQFTGNYLVYENVDVSK
ncbi:hypothetical protein Tco_1398476, partial [Tanacetum coccineum]